MPAKITPKYPHLVYPEESKNNPQLNPDNYPLWTEPKDWTTPRSEIYAATPEVFKKMKKFFNPLNVIRTKTVWIEELRSRMNRGNWSLMDTIEYGSDEILGNGHHRVEAGAGSNAVVLIRVSYGHNPMNFYKYDDNYKRDNATVIGIHRNLSGATAKKDAAVISSALTWVTRYWDEKIQSLEARTAIYKEDRLVQDEKHPEMEAMLANIRNIAKANKVTAKNMPTQESILLALYTLGSDVNPSKTKEFIRDVIVGLNLDANDPAWVYREFLRAPFGKKLVAAGHSKNGRVYTSFKVKKGLMALRYHLDGVQISRLVDRNEVPRLSVEHDELFESYLKEQADLKKAQEKQEKAQAKKAMAAAAGVGTIRVVAVAPKN